MLRWIRRLLPLTLALGLAATLWTPAEAAGMWFPFGQCTYWAALKRPDIGAIVHSNAWGWSNDAEAAGHATGPLPQPGAIVVYQPGIHGAGWLTGHVAYVEDVAEDGQHFLLSEMNGFAGLGHLDQRWDVADRGVRFVY